MQPKLMHRQHRSITGATLIGFLLTLAGMLGSVTPALAADAPDVVFDYPAGVACWFDLRVEISLNQNRVERQFTDKNGNLVRMLTAGKGSTLVFTNLVTGKTLSLKPNGAVEHITMNPDGSRTVTFTGHNVVILFPNDVPAGPSTTLHMGRVTYAIDPNQVFTLQSIRGQSTDICGALP